MSNIVCQKYVRPVAIYVVLVCVIPHLALGMRHRGTEFEMSLCVCSYGRLGHLRGLNMGIFEAYLPCPGRLCSVSRRTVSLRLGRDMLGHILKTLLLDAAVWKPSSNKAEAM